MNTGGLSMEQLANKNLDPNLFVPVCKFSDNFYRTAKNAVYALAGPETYQVLRLFSFALSSLSLFSPSLISLSRKPLSSSSLEYAPFTAQILTIP
jgi:hypothetical protein